MSLTKKRQSAAQKMQPENEKGRFRFDELDEDILAVLQEKQIEKETVLAAVKCDLLPDGTFAGVWVLLLPDALLVVEPESFSCYGYDEFDEFKSQQYIATGILVGVSDGQAFPLAHFTNHCQIKMGHMANMAQKLKKGEDISGDGQMDEEERFCPECGTPYPDLSHKVCPKCTNKRTIFWRVMSYAPRYKLEIGGVILLMLLITVINLIKPYISGQLLYDDVLTKGGRFYGMILPVVLVIFSVDFIKMFATIYQGRLGAQVAAKIIYDLKVELFSAMQKLSMSFYNSKQTGSLMTRVNNDALDIQYFLNDCLPFIIINLVMLVSMAVIMSTFDAFLTLMVFLPLPFVVLIMRKVLPKVKKIRWRFFAKNSRLNSVINDTLSGMRVVKAFGKEEKEIERFEAANQELYLASYRSSKASGTYFPFMWYLMGLGALFIWGIGGWKVVNGDQIMTFGVLMTFVNYTGFIYGPLNFLISCFDRWAACMNAAQRIFEVMDRKSDVKEAKKPTPMPDMKGEVSLENVTFAYEPNKPVLHSINLNIKAGEMIGLVGHSGAGKSTITNLITRLYDVTEGKITIDGVNIKDIKLKDLRGQIGMVLQETFLFSGTIAENISYAKPGATREEIITAAKLGNCHDFIMKLPDGYETMLGRRGVNLSGGERQRISIARAILVNPRILILDEATASVDTETEQQIQQAIERLVKGRTTIAIAHRLSTLRNADRLVVVDKGTIAEVGTHEELEGMQGIYYNMLQAQKKSLAIRGVADEEVAAQQEKEA